MLGLFITGCGSSGSAPEEVVTKKLSRDNAKVLTSSINTSLKDTKMLQFAAQDYSISAKEKNSTGNNDSKLLMFCGDNSQTDNGRGAIDLNVAFSLSSVTIDFDFQNCQLTEPLYIDGNYVLQTQGDPFAFIANPDTSDFSFVSTLNELNIVNSETQTDTMIDGEWQQTVSFADSVYQLDLLADLSLSTSDSNSELIGWQELTTFNIDTSELLITMSGQYKTSDVVGVITVSTIEPLYYQLQLSADSSIDQASLVSGIIKITADDASSVTVTILDSENAQLDIDSDGDGSIDDTMIVAIADLKFMDLVPSS